METSPTSMNVRVLRCFVGTECVCGGRGGGLAPSDLQIGIENLGA